MSNIADIIRDFGESRPRVVADLHSTTFEIKYVREDVAGRYSDRDFDEAYKLIMANTVTGDEFKSLIGEGQFNAQTLFFDDIVVFFFPSQRYEGVFASFDYDGSFPVNELVKQVSETRTES
ncbi:hypothetical protein [Haloarcula japonica]|uniref:Uncharacterized protein n=1 Tax=Haloarcula japonica (strain ATCC 49778 / DSM 6131 / JCM 7785 / NBRC 101032 / NCIMB 13157 / TR-1) TaxID=1227453 RepID=M0LQE7_HALJT|nr:hypothetical protein [Haloarcula japonica]EMA34270.1 hypothetical protein C444_02006 [Haloarcula japonica DSM 6131]